MKPVVEALEGKRKSEDDKYMQAVYETGARITHDIKNLLQSLQTTTSAMQAAKSGDDAELKALIARQLPHGDGLVRMDLFLEQSIARRPYQRGDGLGALRGRELIGFITDPGIDQTTAKAVCLGCKIL